MLRLLKDHLIPHEGNDWKPHLLQRAAMIGMVLLVVLSFLLANIQAMVWVNVDWMVSTILPAVIVTKTNTERSDDTLGLLTRNEVLDQAAQLKAEDMAKQGYFSHYSPSGVSPWYWFGQVDYRFMHAGENLAVHFNDSGEVVKAWMESPTHRANIMNGNFTEIGIGVAEGKFEGYDTVFVVQLFGTPVGTPVPPTNNTITAIAEGVPTSTPAEARSSVAGVSEQVVTELIEASDEDQVVAVSEVSTEMTEDQVPEAATIEVAPALVDFTEVLAYADTVATETAPEEVVDETIPAAESPEDDPYTPIATTTIATDDIVPGAATVAAVPTGRWLAFFGVLTEPKLLLQFMYVAVAIVVLMTLLLSLAIEWRRQHPAQLLYSASLFAAMIFLWYVHTSLISGVIIG